MHFSDRRAKHPDGCDVSVLREELEALESWIEIFREVSQRERVDLFV